MRRHSGSRHPIQTLIRFSVMGITVSIFAITTAGEEALQSEFENSDTVARAQKMIGSDSLRAVYILPRVVYRVDKIDDQGNIVDQTAIPGGEMLYAVIDEPEELNRLGDHFRRDTTRVTHPTPTIPGERRYKMILVVTGSDPILEFHLFKTVEGWNIMAQYMRDGQEIHSWVICNEAFGTFLERRFIREEKPVLKLPGTKPNKTQ